jgi:hypothetical protein
MIIELLMNKLLKYLQLNNIGFLELLFACYPILLCYNYWGIPGDVFVIIVIDIVAIIRRPRAKCPGVLALFFAYVLIHELVVFFFCTNQPTYMLNSIISMVVRFISIPLIISAINPGKIAGAFNLVAIACIIGIFYHVSIILAGGTCSPIQIPGLYAPMESRFFQESPRAISFFFEPQAYCSFMLIPLFFSVRDRKVLWTTIIIVSMFASASTTGIILAPVVLLTYAFTQKTSLKIKLFYVVLTVSFIYALFSLSLFEQGVDKLQNTEASTNERLSSGINYVSHVDPSYLILGIPSANPTDYYLDGGLTFGADLHVGRFSQSLYISTFWLILIKFGIVGLLMYLGIYLKPLKYNKSTMLLVTPLICAMFSNPDYINSAFVTQVVLLYSLIKKQIHLKKNEGTYINYTVRK